VGKTEISLGLASHFDAEILSADSRQLYKEISIGTAKPSSEQLRIAPHHFISSHSIQKEFSAGDFEREGLKVLEEIFSRKDLAILCGGSGLYIKALLEGMDEQPSVKKETLESLNSELAKKGLGTLVAELKTKDPLYWEQVDRSNPQRIIRALSIIRESGIPFTQFRTGKRKERFFKTIKVGIEIGRKDLYLMLDQRMDTMIKQGLFNEAEQLFELRHINALQTVGYQEIFGYMEGKYDKAEAIRLLKRNTRRYAKRQITWFKKDNEIAWFSPKDTNQIQSYIEGRLKSEV
jgi:tRNA dimethylallyltransferase